MVEGGRCPARYSMTNHTVRGKLCSDMIRVRRLIVICKMATGASIWYAGVIAMVTSVAIPCNHSMRTDKGINAAMVKGGRGPSRFTVAKFTI